MLNDGVLRWMDQIMILDNFEVLSITLDSVRTFHQHFQKSPCALISNRKVIVDLINKYLKMSQTTTKKT